MDKPRQTREFTLVEPVNLRILVDELGTAAAAAEVLGVSPATVSKNLADNSTRQITELAAKSLLAERRPAPTKRYGVWLVTGTPEAFDPVQKVAEALDFDVSLLEIVEVG